MAAPSIVGSGIWTGTGTGSGTFTSKARCPAGIIAGDLIIVLWMRNGATGTGTLDAKWTSLIDTGANNRGVRVAYAVAIGTESSLDLNFVDQTNVSTDAGSSVIVLRGWGRAPEAAVTTGGASTTPNPPNLAPSYGSAEVRWIAAYFMNVLNTTMTAIPSGYTSSLDNSFAGQGLDIAAAAKSATAASEDPGTFTASNSGTWHTVTIGVPGIVVHNRTDAGSGADTSAETYTVPVTDAGAGSETSVETANLPRTDTGTGVDQVGDRTFGATDAGAGSEVAAQSLALLGTDAGAGDDSARVVLAVVDSGTGTEEVGRAIATIDSGTGTDEVSARAIATIDSGTGTDSAVLDRRVVLPFPEPELRGRVTAEFLDAARFGGTILTRIRLLDENHDPIEEITGEDGFVITGGVAMDRTRPGTRRTTSLTIANPHGIWTPSSYSDKLWMGKRFSVETGFKLPTGRIELYQLGVFLIDSPETVLAQDAVVKVTAQDRWKVGLKSKFRIPFRAETGGRVDALIFELGALAGYGTDPNLYALDDGGAVLSAPSDWDVGTSISDAMLRVAKLYSLDLFMDRFSKLTLRPITTGEEPAYANLGESQYTLAPGEDSVLLGITKGLSDERLYNATMVEGSSPNRPSIVAEARDLNPLSPAYNPTPGSDPNWPNGGPIGDRLLAPVRSARVLDHYQAQQMANVLLLENGLIEVAYQLETLPLAFLEPFDTVTVNEPITGTAADLLLDALTVPLDEKGSQQLQSKELRSMR